MPNETNKTHILAETNFTGYTSSSAFCSSNEHIVSRTCTTPAAAATQSFKKKKSSNSTYLSLYLFNGPGQKLRVEQNRHTRCLGDFPLSLSLTHHTITRSLAEQYYKSVVNNDLICNVCFYEKKKKAYETRQFICSI